MKTRLIKDPARAKVYKQINICINLDHGKNHSRILANFISQFFKMVTAGGMKKVTLAHSGMQDVYMTMPKLFRGPLEYYYGR
jgi:metal-dependent HD superfamily phosphatase/phosphodiesterase